jgi:hypothetical protein
MRTWFRFVVFALLIVGLYVVLGERGGWPPSREVYLLAIAGLAGLGLLLIRRDSPHQMARSTGASQPAEPQQEHGRPGRAALVAEKLEQTLAGTLERGERVDVRVHCGTGQAIVVTDRRAVIMRATPFRKSARVRSFPFDTVLFAELRTNLNIQGGRLRIGVVGDSPAGPFAPVRPSWGGDEMKFVDFSLDLQEEMEQAAALIMERSGAIKPAVAASV